MLVGYIDEDDHYFCPRCWAVEASSGRRPTKVIDDESAPEDNFWLVDNCATCQRHIKYTEVRLLA